MSSRTIDEVKNLVMAAFRDEPVPLRDLTTGNSGEARDITAAFLGKKWDELTDEFLLRHHQSPCFFTPSAFRYYLPAYLLAVLARFDAPSELYGSVVYYLVPPQRTRGKQQRERFVERTALLTEGQRLAVKAFLEFLQASHPGYAPTRALKREIDELRWAIEFFGSPQAPAAP